MDKNRVHVASALTGILGNQKADALAGKSTSKEKTGKDRVVQYMWQGAVMRRRMPTAFKSQRRRSWKETRLSSSAITTSSPHLLSMDFSIRAANLDDCKDIARMIMVSGNVRAQSSCVCKTFSDMHRSGWHPSTSLLLLSLLHGSDAMCSLCSLVSVQTG